MALDVAVFGALPGLLIDFLIQRNGWEHGWPKIGIVFDNWPSIGYYLLLRVRCTLVNFLLVMVLVVEVIVLLRRLDGAAQNHRDNGPLGGIRNARIDTRITSLMTADYRCTVALSRCFPTDTATRSAHLAKCQLSGCQGQVSCMMPPTMGRRLQHLRQTGASSFSQGNVCFVALRGYSRNGSRDMRGAPS